MGVAHAVFELYGGMGVGADEMCCGFDELLSWVAMSMDESYCFVQVAISGVNGDGVWCKVVESTIMVAWNDMDIGFLAEFIQKCFDIISFFVGGVGDVVFDVSKNDELCWA